MESGARSSNLPVDKTCPSCRMSVPAEANFCPHCGYRLRSPPPSTRPGVVIQHRQSLLDVARGIGAYSTLVLLILLIVNIVILIWSLGVVLPETADYNIYLFIVTPWIVNLVELGGVSFAIYHLFLVAAITASFFWIVWKSRLSFPRELRIAPLPTGHSPLYLVGTMFFALLSFNFIYYLALGAMGITPTSPDYDSTELWKLLYSLANASVWEEIITRVLFIGVPLLLFDALRRNRMRWKSYFLGGGMTLGGKEAALLVFSSCMFAAAHLTNWDLFKVPPAFIAGLVMGYLFIKVGLHAAILLHFSFDYLSVPIYVSDSLLVSLLIGFAMLAWIVVGAFYFYYYTVRTIGYATGRALWPPGFLRPKPLLVYAAREPGYATIAKGAEVSGSPRPAPYEQSGFGFTCRYCGHDEARYKDGGFYCMRCGRRD
jgi:hypothetical protein